MVLMALLSPTVYAMRSATRVMHVQTAASTLLSKGCCHLHVVFFVWLALLVFAWGDNWMVLVEEWLSCEVAVSFRLGGGFG